MSGTKFIYQYIVSARPFLKNKVNKNNHFRSQNTDKLLDGYLPKKSIINNEINIPYSLKFN